MKHLLLVATISVLASCASQPESNPVWFSGPDWFQRTVVYQIWVRSFYDSNQDGIGDLRGIEQRLDYLASLGVGAIWLSPIYPSPFFDSGYDVADYTNVNPDYGSLQDLDRLLNAAHQRGIRVLLDLVLNHTSISHSWFTQSRASTDNPKRNWYLWAKEPNIPCPTANPSIFGSSAWTKDEATGEYYFHKYYPQQPDLNFWEPQVPAAMLDIARFWLDRGVDGFRVDAIADLYEGPSPDGSSNAFICRNHPNTHLFLQQLRTVLDGYPDRAMLAEAWGSPEETALYFGNGGNEFHLSFSASLSVTLLGALTLNAPDLIRSSWQTALGPAPPEAQFGLWLSNHDQPRIASSLDDDPRRAKLAAVLLLTLPGTPVVYYGDEVGMHNGGLVQVDSRDQSRTPMQWNNDPSCGFSTADPWLAPAPDCPQHNVAIQDQDVDSLLTLHRRLIALRNRLDVFGRGDFSILSNDNPSGSVLIFVRESRSQQALVALNFSDAPQSFTLDQASLKAHVLTAVLFSGTVQPQPLTAESSMTIDLSAYGFSIWSTVE